MKGLPAPDMCLLGGSGPTGASWEVRVPPLEAMLWPQPGGAPWLTSPLSLQDGPEAAPPELLLLAPGSSHGRHVRTLRPSPARWQPQASVPPPSPPRTSVCNKHKKAQA